MCIEEKKLKLRNLTMHTKNKKNKENDKSKIKVDMATGINKVSTSGTNLVYAPKCHHYKNCCHIRKYCIKFKY
jgi:hypothetical protein